MVGNKELNLEEIRRSQPISNKEFHVQLSDDINPTTDINPFRIEFRFQLMR